MGERGGSGVVALRFMSAFGVTGRKPLGLETEALLGLLNHGLCRADLGLEVSAARSK